MVTAPFVKVRAERKQDLANMMGELYPQLQRQPRTK